MRAAIFLDRDGTIIEDQHYPKDPNQVRFVQNAVEGLKLMRQKGYLLFVISNQSGVGRGLIKDEEFRGVHEKLCQILKSAAVEIDGFHYCFHHPKDQCLCRKPGIGLIPKNFNQEEINWKESFTVGDKLSDLELADNLGGQGCLVKSGKGKETFAELQGKIGYNKYKVFSDLLAMAQWLPDKT